MKQYPGGLTAEALLYTLERSTQDRRTIYSPLDVLQRPSSPCSWGPTLNVLGHLCATHEHSHELKTGKLWSPLALHSNKASIRRRDTKLSSLTSLLAISREACYVCKCPRVQWIWSTTCRLGDMASMFVGLNGGRKSCGHIKFVICERSFKRCFLKW